MSERARTALALSALVVMALALRLYRLGDVPFGFHPDEGHNALDAWRIVQGWRPVFLPGNNGREPLFMYLMAGTMALFGPSIWAARLAAVVAGALMIPAQFLFVQALPLPRPRRTALISAGLVAMTFWPVDQARYALRANLLPLWVALVLWSWWRVLAGRGYAWAGLSGVFLAAAAHTHLAGRLLPLVLVASALWLALRARRAESVATPLSLPAPPQLPGPQQLPASLQRPAPPPPPTRPRPLRALVVALTVAGVLTLPLLQYFRGQPEMLSYRTDQVSVLNPAVNEGDLAGTLIENTWHLLLMPFVRGDGSWYHNLAGRPGFEPWIGLAFLIGLAYCGRDASGRRGRDAQVAAVLVIATFAVTLAPSWLSVGAPNYVRLTGVWPVLLLLPAWGLERAAAWLGTLDLPPHSHARSGPVLAAIALGLTLVATTRDYFGRYATAPEVYQAFNGAAVERGYEVARLAAAGPTYVSPAIWQQSVIRFICLENPPTAIDTSYGLALPAAGGADYAFGPAELAAADAFGARWPELRRTDIADSRGELSVTVYHLSRLNWPQLTAGSGRPVALPVPVAFGDSITLAAAAVEPVLVAPGGVLTVTLEWLAIAPTTVDMNFFVHLVVPDGRLVGQFDGPPLGGSYATDRWRAGERIRQSVSITLAADAPPARVEVRVGWYDWRTLERLSVPGDPDAALAIGAVEVARR